MVQLGRGFGIETLNENHRFAHWVPSRRANCVKNLSSSGDFGTG
jgi:hypothetical protein